ncbi:GNAT family N-acetyltransferase [Paenibacillus xylanexedens]|uniref:GNAT family N-acetyltransferase n=1 Tax=Paenibacillus xylanexedens TaxID=528191 RepID=UPI0011A817DF|nr:GNAT family N-acetyltransferase [Paenibacillus xylanexedens]
MTEHYRLATLEDAESLLAVTLDAYETIRALNIPFPAGHATLEVIQNNVTQHECYLLEEDGQIIATVTLDRAQDVRRQAISSYPFIRWFAVSPNHKGKGYGSRLLDWVEKEVILNKLDEPAVYLATATRHPWLAPMYERKGYTPFHTQVVQTPDASEEIVFMIKVLDPKRYHAQSVQTG